MSAPLSAPAYDITRSYDWNYAHAPTTSPALAVPACPGQWDFCGIRVASPLGMPAGPLLNSQWILYYAALGFDVLTYKTVRSSARNSYSPPNLVPLRQAWSLAEGESAIAADRDQAAWDSWAISFGMPSKDPAVWQEDVQAARRALPADKVLVVSVVASPEPEWTLDDIAWDFARCARCARDGGAQAIEANLSCPNVATREGDLYASPDASRAIAMAMRDAVPELPLVLKVGLFDDGEHAAAFVEAVTGTASAISTTNTISAVITGADGAVLFGGSRRGIGGLMIGRRCLAELTMLRGLIDQSESDLRLIAVGGVGCAQDVVDRLAGGAHHVQLATAAMINPGIGVEIRGQLARAAEHRGHAAAGRSER